MSDFSFPLKHLRLVKYLRVYYMKTVTVKKNSSDIKYEMNINKKATMSGVILKKNKMQQKFQ